MKQYLCNGKVITASSKQEAFKIQASTEETLFDEIDCLYFYMNQEADLLCSLTGNKKKKCPNIKISSIEDAVTKLHEMNAFYEANFKAINKLVPEANLKVRPAIQKLSAPTPKKKLNEIEYQDAEIISSTMVIASFKDAEKKFSAEESLPVVKDYIERFKKIKPKILEKDKVDIGYWMKKGFSAFKKFVVETETKLSKTQTKKLQKSKGASLVKETDKLYIFHITSFEASKQYGDNTDWCITRNKSYWDSYTGKGDNFYFAIQKNKKRTDDVYYKVACEVHRDGKITYWDADDSSHTTPPSWLKPFVGLMKSQKEFLAEAIVDGDVDALSNKSALEIIDTIKELKIAKNKISKKILNIKCFFGTIGDAI